MAKNVIFPLEMKLSRLSFENDVLLLKRLWHGRFVQMAHLGFSFTAQGQF